MPNDSRRDRHDIVAEILETAKDGVSRTHVMYEAKLSYAQIKEYISLLVEKGFLENCPVEQRRQTKRLVKTTEQGEKLLENIKSANLLWSISPTSEQAALVDIPRMQELKMLFKENHLSLIPSRD